MNKDQAIGFSAFVTGTVQYQLARLTGNKGLEASASQKMVNGKIRFAIGEAQKIIERSLRASAATRASATNGAMASVQQISA